MDMASSKAIEDYFKWAIAETRVGKQNKAATIVVRTRVAIVIGTNGSATRVTTAPGMVIGITIGAEYTSIHYSGFRARYPGCAFDCHLRRRRYSPNPELNGLS